VTHDEEYAHAAEDEDPQQTLRQNRREDTGDH
jgi:hypothetical protein